MKAIVLKGFGGRENLHLEDIPTPTINANAVLIQTKAFSINPVDIKTRSGKSLATTLKDENPLILGWDVAGVVTQAGSDVTDLKPGDEVFGMVNFPGHGQAYAEFVAASAGQLVRKPATISFDEAAAATLAALTAWQALITHAKLKAGQRVLIHAAAGGVGHYAVQIAKYLGAYAVGTSSAANRDFVLGLGADEHIDYTAGPFEDKVKDMDLVLDAIGGEMIDRSLNVLRKGGTIITFPTSTSAGVVEKAAAKGMTGIFFVVSINREDLQQLAELLDKGIVKSHVSHTYTIERIREAHAQIETGKTVGKIVVSL